MSFSASPRVDLSYWAKRKGGRRWVVGVEAELELTGDWRPRNQGFPVLWSRGLVKERSRRMLDMWRNFGCEGFECRGAELADSIDERELLRRHPWRAQGGEGDEGEAQEGVRQVASSGEGRGRLGDSTDDRARGDVPRRHATASGGVGAITANRASPGETGRREGERMTCGGHM